MKKNIILMFVFLLNIIICEDNNQNDEIIKNYQINKNYKINENTINFFYEREKIISDLYYIPTQVIFDGLEYSFLINNSLSNNLFIEETKLFLNKINNKYIEYLKIKNKLLETNILLKEIITDEDYNERINNQKNKFNSGEKIINTIINNLINDIKIYENK